MAVETYETVCWGQTYRVRANWAQASSPVEVQYEDGDWMGDPHGRQVADFRHWPERAMRDWIAAGEDDSATDDIDEAVARMTAAD